MAYFESKVRMLQASLNDEAFKSKWHAQAIIVKIYLFTNNY
jgi:hypothetical protein